MYSTGFLLMQRADPRPASPHDAAQEASTTGAGHVRGRVADKEICTAKETGLAAYLTSASDTALTARRDCQCEKTLSNDGAQFDGRDVNLPRLA
jgi:hypothetical protein